MAEAPSIDEDDVRWCFTVGRYVQRNWLAEERKRGNRPFKDIEHELMEIWDDCNEKEFRDLRVDAEAELEEYIENRASRLTEDIIIAVADVVASKTREPKWLEASWAVGFHVAGTLLTIIVISLAVKANPGWANWAAHEIAPNGAHAAPALPECGAGQKSPCIQK